MPTPHVRLSHVCTHMPTLVTCTHTYPTYPIHMFAPHMYTHMPTLMYACHRHSCTLVTCIWQAYMKVGYACVHVMSLHESRYVYMWQMYMRAGMCVYMWQTYMWIGYTCVHECRYMYVCVHVQVNWTYVVPAESIKWCSLCIVQHTEDAKPLTVLQLWGQTYK